MDRPSIRKLVLESAFARGVLGFVVLITTHCSGSERAAEAESAGEGGAGNGGESGGASSGIGGDSSGMAGASSAGAGGFDVTGAASLAELSSIFSARCTGCHDGTRAGLVDLRSDSGLYARLTTPLATQSCNGRILVVPGSVGESLLPAKVQPRPPCGARMPSECSVQGCLSAAEIQTIVNYVGSGAPEQ